MSEQRAFDTRIPVRPQIKTLSMTRLKNHGEKNSIRYKTTIEASERTCAKTRNLLADWVEDSFSERIASNSYPSKK